MQSSVYDLFFGHEWQQPDEACAKNGLANGSLEQGRRSSSTARQNAAFAVDQRSEGLQVLVVHVHWTWHYTTASELAAHLFLLQTSTTLTELLQICARNCCHETTYNL